jgi:hypothetical protein
MFEHFTDRARKVMQLANQQAGLFGHECLGTEHILLGLVTEGSGVADVLQNLRVDPRAVRSGAEKLLALGVSGEQVMIGRSAYTLFAKRALEYAAEEARRLEHKFIGAEHLLLALLRDQESGAARVLVGLGLELEGARREVRNLLGPDTPLVGTVTALTTPDATPTPVALASIDPDEPVKPIHPRPIPLNPKQLQTIRERIRHLTKQKDAFVGAMDFGLAERCQYEADALTRLVEWYEWARARR